MTSAMASMSLSNTGPGSPFIRVILAEELLALWLGEVSQGSPADRRVSKANEISPPLDWQPPSGLRVPADMSSPCHGAPPYPTCHHQTLRGGPAIPAAACLSR